MKVHELFEEAKFSFSRINLDDLNDQDLHTCAKWIKNNAQEYFSTDAIVPIYRGMNASHYEGIYNTKNIHRQSKGDVPNFYTLWVDNAPQWSEYPKRSSSLICSSAYTGASSYGSVYQIIPSDSCRIGVVPTYDIWFAFKPALSFFKRFGLDRKFFVDTMTELGKIFGLVLDIALTADDDESIRSKFQTNWADFSGALKELTPDLIRDTVRENTFKWDKSILRGYMLLAKMLDHKGFGNLFEMLEVALEPQKNHFNVLRPGQMTRYRDTRELWVGGGEVLALRTHNYPHVMKALKSL